MIATKKRITNNFLVVSCYNNNVDWVPEYTDDYIIYTKGDAESLPLTIDRKKVQSSPNIGYNLYDYFTFIVDNYNNLPDCTIFTKGNVFPRHVTKEYFDRIMNNNFFTPIDDLRLKETWPKCYISSDGGLCEINNSWYLQQHPSKYFSSYNHFLEFCFKDPILPRYIRFAPGANYIVPRQNIQKFPKIFYENLRTFVSHSQLPGEAHIIERALHTLWTCTFEVSDAMMRPLPADFTVPAYNTSNSTNSFSTLKRSIKSVMGKIFTS